MAEGSAIVESVKAEFARQDEEVAKEAGTEEVVDKGIDDEGNPVDVPGEKDEDAEDAAPGSDADETGKEEVDTDEVDDELDPELVARAEKVGMDQEDLTALGDKAEMFLSTLEEAAKVKAGAEVKPDEVEAEVEEEAPAEIPTLTVEQLVDSGLDEDVAKIMVASNEGLVNMVKEQAKALKDLTSNQEASAMEAKVDSELEDFHGRLGKLDDSYDEVFGSEDFVKEGSKELKARSELYETMNDLIDGNANRGKTISREVAFSKALKMVAPDVGGKKKVATLKEKAKERQGLIISKPNTVEKGGKSSTDKEVYAKVEAIIKGGNK